MTALQLMNDKRQYEIVSAVQDAVDLHADGMSANDALIKVASDRKFNSNIVKLCCDAFNTGKQLAHHRSNGRGKRADSFELADFDVVAAKLFPKGEHAKAAMVRLPADDQIPNYLTRKVASTEKVASAEPTERQIGEDEGILVSKALAASDYWNKLARGHEDQAVEMQKTAHQAVVDLIEQFQRPGLPADSWAVFEKEARAIHGAEIEPILDLVYQDVERLNRYPRSSDKLASQLVVDDTTLPHKLLKIAWLASNEVVDSRLAAEQLRKTAGEKRASVFTFPLSKSAAFADAGQLLFLSDRVGQHMGQMRQTTPAQVTVRENLGLKSELDRARLEMAIRDMAENDEVIAKHMEENPARVPQIMHDITKVSPGLLEMPMALRSAVRRHLELGQLDPHEIQQFQDIGKGDTLEATTGAQA